MLTMLMGMAHMWAREFDECVAWSERAINPRALAALRTLIVGLVYTNQQERAAEMVREHLRMDPSFTVSSWVRQRAPHFRKLASPVGSQAPARNSS